MHSSESVFAVTERKRVVLIGDGARVWRVTLPGVSGRFKGPVAIPSCFPGPNRPAALEGLRKPGGYRAPKPQGCIALGICDLESPSACRLGSDNCGVLFWSAAEHAGGRCRQGYKVP